MSCVEICVLFLVFARKSALSKAKNYVLPLIKFMLMCKCVKIETFLNVALQNYDVLELTAFNSFRTYVLALRTTRVEDVIKLGGDYPVDGN